MTPAMQPLKEYLEPGSLPYRERDPRFLMSRPQPLGVLPTLWFWRELRTERPLLSMLVGLFMGAFGVSASLTFLAAGVSVPMGFIATLSLPYFALGILERCLRRAVLRRRRALAQSDSPGELPPALPATPPPSEHEAPD